jgi:hypothetical protein
VSNANPDGSTTVVPFWDPTQMPPQTDPWAAGVPANHAPVTLGNPNVAGATFPASTFPQTFTIQLPFVDPTVASPVPLSTLGWPGPNPLTAAGNKFPFGGFARNADMLQIPFIGAYVVDNDVDSTNGFIEMNSISMDAAFAEDTDTTDDEPNPDVGGVQPREQIGRFCPIFATSTASAVDDYGFGGTTDVTKYRYAWSKKLFDYLTVQTPSDDYLPNPNPAQAIAAGLTTVPQAIDNDGDGQANATVVVSPAQPTDAEDTYPAQGLININTAPWRVLAALPMLPTGDANALAVTNVSNVSTGTWVPGANQVEDNIELAQAIVKWRD